MDTVRRLWTWLWTTWQVYGLWHTFGTWATGASLVPVIGPFAHWPLSVQIGASAGVAVLWLSLLTAVVHRSANRVERGQGDQATTSGESAAAAGQGARAIRTGDQGQVATEGATLVGRDQVINYVQIASTYSEQEVLQRAIEEAKINRGRKGRSALYPDVYFVELAYLHKSNTKWPEDLRAALTRYRKRVLFQAKDAPPDRMGLSSDYYRKHVVPVIEDFIEKAEPYLSELGEPRKMEFF